MPRSGNTARKRAARTIQAETGLSYTAALREADRRHAAEAPVGVPVLSVGSTPGTSKAQPLPEAVFIPPVAGAE